MKTRTKNKQSPSRFPSRLKPAYAAVLLAFTVQTVQANPTDATVVSGQVGFATAGNTLTVTNTPGAIIHWQGFSIGANEITRFAQQSASSAVLNRVVSNNPSSILGTLQSNGRVFLINPNGIVFGAGATVDVAGLVASTLNLSNADFLAGRYSFTEVPGAQKISNAGNISSRDGGQIYLIAPDVENTGVITAPNGEILLAAGHSVDLVNTNSPNLIVNITSPAGDATNVGQLIASSGSLGLFGTVVRNSGTVSADSATIQGGKIVFRSSQRTEAGGTASASGNGGGEIKMLSDMQTGTVSVTGTLDASAPVSGDGGFIDTSAAHVQVADTARITTAALNGKYGTWLIDPTDYTISATDPLNGSSWMSGTALGSALDAGNVTIQTLATGGGAGDILINDNVTKVATGGLTSLTLQAHNNILVSAGNFISSIGFALNVVLTSNSDGVGGGGIYLDTGSSIISNGGNITLGGIPSVGYAIGNGSATGGKIFNSGIYVLGNITAGAGNVTMRGEGRALNSGSNHLADGITFAGGLLSSNGTVIIDGVAHVLSASTAGTDVTAGVDFLGAGTRLSTQTGTVTVTGLNDAGAGFCRAQGITVEAGTIIETTGIGTLTLNGTSTGLDTGWGVGIFGGTVRTTAAGGGAITLNGINVTNPDGGVVIQDGSVLSSGGEIRIIGAGLGGSGTIGTSTIGGASSGDILIKANNSGPINITSASSINAGSNTLTLILAGGPFNDNGSSITAGSLRLLGTGTFNLGGTNNNVGTLAANVTGNVAYKDNNGFIIGSVTSFDGTATTTTTGVTTNNSNFTGTTVGNITLNVGSAINTGTGAVTLSAAGGNLNINGDVSAGTFTLSGGTWNQVSATLPGFTVNDFRITSGTFIRAIGGVGSIADPYQLADIYGVQGMGSSGMLGYSYELANDINAAGTLNWNAGAGFLEVGDGSPGIAFTGQLDGKGFTINGLTINRPAKAGVGLFGWLGAGAVVSNVGLVGGSVTGWYRAGGLAGYNAGSISNTYVSGMAVSEAGASTLGGLVGQNGFGGSISNSYVDSGTVSGSGRWVGGLAGLNFGNIDNSHVSNTTVAVVISGNSVGGLVGWNDGSIGNSYVSNGSVMGATSVGGLVGWNTAIISNSYVSNGNVTGTWNIGGLVGANYDSISDSYVVSANVTGSNLVGGLAGFSNGSISNSYVSSGYVWGSSNVGGLLGMKNGLLANSHYNIDVVSIQDGNHVTLGGLFGAQYVDWYGTGIPATGGLNLNIADYSSTLPGSGNNYTINDVQGMKDLLGFADNAAYTFSLGADIDLALDAGLFIPYLAASFNGSNGTNFYTISNLNVDQSFNDNLGLFGHIATGSTVSNVALLNAAVMGNSNVGALAGWNQGTISNSHVSGATTAVSGLSNVGGLAGLNDNGSINSSDVIGGNVIGPSNIGGLAGQNYFGTIDGSHVSAVNVGGGTTGLYVGGLVGQDRSGVISNSYVDSGTVVTGGTHVGGLLGFDGAEGQGVLQSNTVTGTTVTGSNYVGGLVGRFDTGWGSTGYVDDNHVVDSFVYGRAGTAYLGGLTGWNGALIRNSSVSGTTVSGGMSFVGGLVGYNTFVGSTSSLGTTIFWGGRISNSYVSGGTVSGNSSVGGLAGSNAGEISNSFVSASAISGGTTISANNVGGLVGNNNGGILNSYASGGTVTGGNSVGGLVGYNDFSGIISFGYADVGSVTGLSNVGGVVGYKYQGTVSDTFWNTALAVTNGIGFDAMLIAGSDTGAAGLTTAQLMTMSSFTGWDIVNTGAVVATWRIYEGNTRPLLTSFLTPLTATANNATKTYDGNAFSGGNGVGYSVTPTLTLLGTPTYGGTSQGAVNAGGYTITASGLYSDQLGYDISYVGGTLTISPAGLVLLNVTASDASKTYGTTLTFNGTEFTPAGLLGGDAISGVTLTSAGAVNTANAGTYAIIPGNAVFSAGSASNYNISYVNGTLTVNALPISIAAVASTRVYGDPDSSSFIATGLMSWDSYAATFTGALSHTGGENVGTYTITQGNLAANANYTVTGFTGNTLTITPAPLSVYAYPTNKIISTPDPLLGYMVSGLKLGDTAAATLNSGSLARDPGEAVGNYQINQGSLALASSNYTMNYFPASFTILAPTVVDEIANAILLLGTPETGSAQSTSSSDEEEKRKAEEAAAAAGTPASGETTTPPLPECPGA